MKKLLIALLAVGVIAPFANAYNEVDPWWVAIGPIQFGTNPPDYNYHGYYPAYYTPSYYRSYYPQNTYSYSYAYAGARSSYSYASSGSYYAPYYSYYNYYPPQSYGGPSGYCVRMAAQGYYVC